MPSFRVEGRLHWISAEVGDFDGTFADIDLKAVYQPWELMGFAVGYRHQMFDFEAEDIGDVENAAADFSLSGVYAGLAFTF